MNGPRQNRIRWKLLAPLGAALIYGMAMARPVAAQVLYGTLVGHVTDPNGAAVPGAKVLITNQGTNISRDVASDSAGDYNFTDVVPGTYTVQVTREGFKTYERKDVQVTLNAVIRADVPLQVGTVSQTIEVKGAPPALQTDTPEVHSNLEASTLEQLPMPPGMNYQYAYRALPGFSPPQNSHSIPTNPSRSLAFNVNGTSNNQNNTRIDGVSTYNVQLPHVTSYVPSLESIQEVNVVTDDFDAEQGFAGGSAINVETKSGTNSFHGSVFENHSNNHLTAWPMLFDGADANVGNKPKLVFNELGGAVGGPIKKDKLFFFSSYQGTFNHRNLQAFGTVPTAAMINGDLSMDTTHIIYDPTTGDLNNASGRAQFSASADSADPTFNALCTPTSATYSASTNSCLNMIPTARLDPITQKILAYLPSPDRPVNSAGQVNRDLFVSGPFHFHRKQVDNKINFAATDKFNLIGTFGFLHYDTFAPTRLGKALGNVISGSGGTSNPGNGSGNTYRTTIMGTYTLTPNFLLDAHFGYAKQGTASVQPFLGTNIGSDVLGIPGTNGTRNFESGWPEFDISGFDTIGIDSNFMPYYRHDPQYQYVANFNWQHGTHNVRFGTDAYRMGLNHQQAEFLSAAYGAQGGFNFNRAVTQSCLTVNADGITCDESSPNSRFNGFASFLLGMSNQDGKALQVPDVYHIHTWLYSAYVRDRWNFRPRLTFDYGLRWEYFAVPARPDRGIERYDSDPASATFNQVLVCGVGSVPNNCGINVSKKLFAPRVGFAYRATDTLVVRAGYGISYDPYFGLEALRDNYPIMVQLIQSSFSDFFPVGTQGTTPASSLQTGLVALTAPSLGNGVIPIPGEVGFSGWPKNFKRGYVESWNISVQKELGQGFTAQAGYVGTRQVRQMAYFNLNAGQVIGAGTAGEPLFNQTLTAPTGPRSADSIELRPFGSGHYNSLQAKLEKRYAKGLSLTVAYTWGKAIDMVDNSDENPGADDGRLQLLQYLYLNRAIAGYDRTHSLSVIHIWDLPFGSGQRWLSGPSVASKIAGGWQMSGLATWYSGAPFTAYSSEGAWNTPGSRQTADQVGPIRRTGVIDPNAPYYDVSAFADVSSARLGTMGFNTLRGPSQANWDLGIYRKFKLSERYNLEFRTLSFNFTNAPPFDLPDGELGDGSSFMSVSGTVNVARESLSQRQFEFALRLTF